MQTKPNQPQMYANQREWISIISRKRVGLGVFLYSRLFAFICGSTGFASAFSRVHRRLKQAL
jgi:hypothetical protein